MDFWAWLGAIIDAVGAFINAGLDWVLDLVQSVDPVARILLSGLGILLETSILIGLVVPGDTIVVVSSTAIDGPVQYVGTLVAVILGALAGESIGFALGRFFGHRIRDSRLGARIGMKNWHRAENYVDRRGGIAVFVSRFLPVLHSLVPVTVGMSTMSYRRFISWTAPACAIWATAYVTVGWVVGGSFKALQDQLHFAGYLFVAAVVLFGVGVLVVKKLIERREARHWDRPGDGDANSRED
jgi:membrane protein DedA with SNARE-associated domain